MLTWEKIYQFQQMEKILEAKRRNKDLVYKYNTLKREKEIIQKEIDSLKKDKNTFELFNNRISQLESDIEEIKKLAKEQEEKLYKGDITNNKELLAAKEHLDQYQTSIESLEDELIKIMEEQEKGKEELEEKTNIIKNKKDDFKKEFDEYQTLKERETIETSEFEEEIHKLRESLCVEERDNLAIYEELKGKYHNDVIAKIENRICMGCHMGVSFEVMKEISKLDRKEPVYCNNCGRIVIQ